MKATKVSLILILAAFLLAACGKSSSISATATPIPPTSTPTLTPTPTPVPPSFQGNLVRTHYGQVTIYHQDNSTNQIKELPIPGFDTYTLITITNKYAIYQDSASTLKHNHFYIVDLVSLESELIVFPIGVRMYWHLDCVSLSDDKAMASYDYLGRLYVYDFATAKTKMIAEAPSGLYSSGPNDIGSIYYAFMDCGYWSGNNTLLFNRYSGSMPSSMVEPPYANTVSMYRDGRMTGNSDYLVRAVSKDGSWVLLQDFTDKFYITKSFDDFSLMDPRPLNLSEPATTSGFTSDNKYYYFTETGFYFIEPQSLQIEDSFNIPDNWPTTDRNYIWCGDALHKTVCFSVYDDVSGKVVGYIGDLITGIATEIFKIDPAETDTNDQLYWFP